MPRRLELGDNLGLTKRWLPPAAVSVDSHMHKSKQLADCDSTPNASKITMYDKGYIVSKKRFPYLFKTDN